MAILHKKGFFESSRVVLISPDQISPNPDQPRQYFDPQGLTELADSIRTHGILQPLTVRKRGNRYELVAGERRLRASRLCGLHEVPCLVLDVDRQDSCLLAIIENLQRRDLDFWEEAQALERLIRTYGLSQEEAAAKVGKSQSAVANKLRLLRLPEEVLSLLRKQGFTERHARALLRLPDGECQMIAARAMVERGLTVAQTEQYIAEFLAHSQEEQAEEAKPKNKTSRRPNILIKDVRFFLNSVNHGLSLMQSAGVQAQCDQVEEADSILLTIRIPKKTG